MKSFVLKHVVLLASYNEHVKPLGKKRNEF